MNKLFDSIRTIASIHQIRNKYGISWISLGSRICEYLADNPPPNTKLVEKCDQLGLLVKKVAIATLRECLVSHAETELKRAGLFDEDSDYGGMVGDAVMELIGVFADQGHSGFSAGMVSHLFGQMAGYNVLTPLTDDPGEWQDISDMWGEPHWQSRRNPSCFSGDGGKTYYDLNDMEETVEVEEDGDKISLTNTNIEKKVMHNSRPANKG